MKTHCKNDHPYTQENTRYNKAGYYFCLACKRERARKWARDNNGTEAVKATRRKGMKKHLKQLRLEAIEAYGRKCTCCGESTPEFLHLDHVNNDGAEHRRELTNRGGSIHTLRWAKKNGWPERLQLRCHNCGMAEAFYGQCPHELGAQ